MYQKLLDTIEAMDLSKSIGEARRTTLEPLIHYLQQNTNDRQEVRLHFICTHNSRRSHFAQIWAQVAAAYYGFSGVKCYSGGTEATALYPMVAQTLADQGLAVHRLTEGMNPVYAVKYSDNALPLIVFSKKYDHPFNPVSAFAAVMTCSQADSECPFIPGAAQRISIPYEDPKESDGRPDQGEVYAKRSLEIAAELFYVFSKINP